LRASPERTLAALDGRDDLLDVLDAGVIRSGQPDRVDRLVRDHVGDRRIGPRRADVELPRVRGRALRVLLVRAPDAENVRVPDAAPSLNVKAGIETTSDESDTEAFVAHWLELTRVFMRS
jgi:hypothetical protein